MIIIDYMLIITMIIKYLLLNFAKMDQTLIYPKENDFNCFSINITLSKNSNTLGLP